MSPSRSALAPRLAVGRPLAGLPLHLGLLGAGAVLGIGSVTAYGVAGYSTPVALAWLAAVLVLAAAFLRESERLGHFALREALAPALLLAAFAPLYLLHLYDWPVQVSSDEVAVPLFAKQYASASDVDLFGLSTFFGTPAVLLVVMGKLGRLLGGNDLEHMRLLNALIGLATIAVAYAFFRQLLTRPWAVVAAAVLGLNHAFLMYSRMAMQLNSVVLVEVTALALLTLGLRRRHPLATFLGGVATGLGFYVYFPGRSVVLVWAVFTVVVALRFRRDLDGRLLVKLTAIAALGFVLTAAPYTIAYAKAPSTLIEHQRQALLLFPEGRQLQQQWVFASSELAGVAKNIEYGLTAFNRPIEDHSWNYQDRGHGFVDPLTGVLLWIGVAVVLAGAIRRRREPGLLLPLAGFILLWLLLAFVVNQAPNYPRMLVTLPLVAVLVAVAVRRVSGLLGRRFGPAVAVAAVLGIGVWNGFIAWDYIDTGRRTGDDIGSTGRYVAAHRHLAGVRFYVAADQGRWNYYAWGTPSIWQERLRMFTDRDAQVGGVVAPTALGKFSASPPFAVFMRRDLWATIATRLRNRYPQSALRDITSDGRLVVFEAA